MWDDSAGTGGHHKEKEEIASNLKGMIAKIEKASSHTCIQMEMKIKGEEQVPVKTVVLHRKSHYLNKCVDCYC